MWTVKAVAFLALACVVLAGKDLDYGFQLMRCAQTAITRGVPELHIPQHTPLHFVHNASWSGHVNVVAVELNLTNGIWYGIPAWDLKATQLTEDGSDYIVYKFDLSWKTMNITFDYSLKTTEVILNQVQHGSFRLNWTDVLWSGTLNVTRPGLTKLVQEVNHADIDWSVQDLTCDINGLGPLNGVAGSTIATTIKEALNLRAVTIGDFIKDKLNTVWWDTGVIWKLTQWCQKNINATSEYY
ncbi:unnamed protein product [Phyllotreta striolata]|uniref:Uncharacterized protein n=1 Tax=Phyllotreta striolata TaxID=444603 RepID=A0A9N9TDL2_PHYSR|nr:unnamed protein product [Phyllotreta striolata]